MRARWCGRSRGPSSPGSALAEPALAHDGPDRALGQQVAQHPQQVRAGRQLGLAARSSNARWSVRCVQVRGRGAEPVVDVAGQRRQGVVADLADPVAAQQDLAQPAHVAAAGHDVLLDAGDRGVLEVVRGRAGPVAHPGEQDRGLEDGDGVGGAGEVAVAAGQPHDVDAPAEQLGLVEAVQRGRAGEEAGQPVGDGGPGGAAGRPRPSGALPAPFWPSSRNGWSRSG